RLATKVQRRLKQAREAGDDLRVERVEQEAHPGDLLAWLAAQPHPAKVYWHGRSEESAVGGVGIADAIDGALEQILPLLETRAERLPVPQARYFGGLRFEPVESPAQEWAAF